MVPDNSPSQAFDQTIASVVTRLIGQTHLSQRELTERSGLSKDQLSRALKGTRQFEIAEALAILTAAGLPGRAAITLTLFDRADLAVEWSQSGLSGFYEALIAALPEALTAELGDAGDRVNPRWGQHAARLVAQRIAQHIEEIVEREERLGDLRLPGQTRPLPIAA